MIGRTALPHRVARHLRTPRRSLACAALALSTACGPQAWDDSIATGPCEATLRHGVLAARTGGVCRAEFAEWTMSDDSSLRAFYVDVPLVDHGLASRRDEPGDQVAHLRLGFHGRPDERGPLRVGSDSADVWAEIVPADAGVEWLAGTGTVVATRDRAGSRVAGEFDLRFVARDAPDTLVVIGRYAMTTVTHDRENVLVHTFGHLR